MNIPYIGITGFTNLVQVNQMISAFWKYRRQPNQHRLHVGVMMSYTTLNGIPSQWTNIFPANKEVARILDSPNAMTCLHYADYKNIDVQENLTKAITYGGPGMKALQLDMVWPDPNAVRSALVAASNGHRLEVILQVGTKAMELAQNDPDEVVYRLKTYKEGLLSHVLLDKSMGQGIPLDAKALLPFIGKIRRSLPNLGISVAGGLGPDSLLALEPIIEICPDISIDAEGKLRPSGNNKDPICWDMADEYLRQALRMLEVDFVI